mmetsp:Transcript_8175/g.9846  ORF Transcript_8175/g.9846 Transcript_8175/m.9846 type:complete len:301 (+) Transcript_8175:543-1445(+)|eukprot:CAMPEP_0184008928 /NCGR_PEP_ID=MMETSP0954-20121128/2284_1 /TAXON_ID=627963 /ORGANISM="Aplanochytrium sp, Strain PBS07" /LENGTH=300 /DNA_ID=CAMNT_0026288169 /DNA_START=491 /DNA_END=1393 /DNA_ORIENTATION=+
MEPQMDVEDCKLNKPKQSKNGGNIFLHGFILLLSSVFRVVGFLWYLGSLVGSIVMGGSKSKDSMKVLRRNAMETREKCKNDPVGTIKTMLKVLWCLGVFLTILSMVGVDVNPGHHLSLSGNGFGIGSFYQPEPVIVETDAKKEDEEEEVLKQNLGPGKKKITKREERAFACAEVDCISTCARKVTKKCMKSESCLNHRAKECKKKCKKKRCEDRCAREPMSYVERETKLEECKEACKTPKCNQKCDNDFQPCRSKCKFLSHKYSCDREPDLPVARVEETPPPKASSAAKQPSNDLLGDDI